MKPMSVTKRALFSFFAAATLTCRLSNAFNIVISGPGSLEVQLIAGKLAEATPGDVASIIVPADPRYLKKCRSLLYDDGSGDIQYAPDGPALVSTGDEIGDALEVADALLIVCEEQAMENSRIDLLLANAPLVKHVGLLSRHGGSLKNLENYLESKCDSARISCSIVRAGILKGGGPGEGGEDGRTEWGLAKYYDNTIFDLLQARTSMAFDKLTLGAKVTAGDPFPFRGGIIGISQSNQSFEPSDTTTARTLAAGALLAAVRRDNGVDVSLSSAKGKIPPTREDWDSLLDAASY